MSTVDLTLGARDRGGSPLPDPVRFELKWGAGYSLWVMHLGLACCAVEFVATTVARPEFVGLGVGLSSDQPDRADIVVVSGTVTDRMAPAILRMYDQLRQPTYVISFGACSNSGGPYWDSYSVTKGVDQIIPVDVYVPGCPPRPEALLAGMIQLRDQIIDAAVRREPSR